MRVRQEWTGNIVGQMHIHHLTNKDVAEEMGVCSGYLQQILAGFRNPKGAQDKIELALKRAIEKKEKQ